MESKWRINIILSFFGIFGLAFLIILLFFLKDNLTDFTSKGMQQQITPISAGIFADSTDYLYNYQNSTEGYLYTLLEFSGAGCSICRRMEKELAALKKTHGSEINIVFYEMTKPNGLRWGKYFGVVMIPTQVILDHEGKEILRNTGFISSEEILSKLNKRGN
jgi:thioredoxin-related protein